EHRETQNGHQLCDSTSSCTHHSLSRCYDFGVRRLVAALALSPLAVDLLSITAYVEAHTALQALETISALKLPNLSIRESQSNKSGIQILRLCSASFSGAD